MLRLMWYLHRRRKDTENTARRALANLLSGARGTSMKAGQWLGTLDGDPALKPLVESVEPRPLAEIRPLVRGAAPREAARALAALGNPEAFAALSWLAQSSSIPFQRAALLAIADLLLQTGPITER